jgi:hypothetical protein
MFPFRLTAIFGEPLGAVSVERPANAVKAIGAEMTVFLSFLPHALLTFILVTASYPAIAKHHYHHRERATSSHSRITREMVRAYIAQVSLQKVVD